MKKITVTILCLTALSFPGCNKDPELINAPGGARAANGKGNIRGEFSIDHGNIFTSTREVTLYIQVSGADEMRFSNDNIHWTPWEKLAPVKKWQLPPLPELTIKKTGKQQTTVPQNEPEPPETSTTVFAEFSKNRYYFSKMKYKIHYFKKKNFSDVKSELFPYFGYSLAMSADAGQLVIGVGNNRSHHEQYRLLGVRPGRFFGVHSYYRGKKQWLATRPLFPVNRIHNASYTVNLSPDGSTMLVMERVDRGGGQLLTLYLYRWMGKRWIREKIFGRSARLISEGYGGKTSLSQDGSIIAVSAHKKTVNGRKGHGAVYIYRWDGHRWYRAQLITGEKDTIHFNCGRGIALSPDGTCLAVSTVRYNRHEKMGSVYIYKNNGKTFELDENIFLTKQDNRLCFGSDVSLSVDGSILVASAPGVQRSKTGGALYVFEKEGDYTLSATLHSPDEEFNTGFGKLARVSMYGNTIGTNAYPEQTPRTAIHGKHPGKIFIFQKTGKNTWEYVRQLDSIHATKKDKFGRELVLSHDGSRVLTGEMYRDIKNLEQHGSGTVMLR